MSFMQLRMHVAPVGLVTSPGLQMPAEIIANGVSSGHEWTNYWPDLVGVCNWMQSGHALTHAII